MPQSLEEISIHALEPSVDSAECCLHLKLMSEVERWDENSMATPTNASQDPWELAKSRFLEDLDAHEKDLFNNATLENIYYSTSNTNRDDAEKSKIRGVVRRLGPLVSAIESYGGAFDAFAQISPQYLSPIWGSIRVVLVVAGSYSKFYDKIVDTLGRIGDILPRFRDYERIYNGQKHRRLYQALSNAYLDIIVLCTEFRKSIREQKNSKVRRILKPLAIDKQFDEAIERFRRHRQNVVDEADTCHMIEAAEQRDAQLVLYAEERRRKLLARLSKVDSKHRHRRLKESRHDGTGAWFTSSSEYEQWKAASQSSVLCCYGIPGCGKSVLVSSVIDLFDVAGTLVFYYCDYSDKRTLEPSNVFATMARQALEQIDNLPETLASVIEQVEHDGEKLTSPAKALTILQKSIELVPGPIFLILDGLDEATESSQFFICNSLKQLIEKSGLSIKLLVTGRDELGSLLMLDPSIPFSRVPVSSTAICLDIENYVRASTRRRISDGLLVISDPNLEQLIVDELVKGAKGMFLWVEFQLHDLCEPESDHGIRLVLQNLPRSLGETYKRLLNKIEGIERRDMIQRMFKWIVCAREPIHLDEMREAVAFTLEDVSYDPRKLPTDLNRLVRACGNLVVVDEETHVIQLAHHTVQQYLLQNGDSPFQFTVKDANVMAGEFCVAYLSFSDFESQVTRYAENKNTDMLALGKIASRRAILPADHPAQKVVHVWNTLRSPRSNAPSINMTRYVPPQRKSWQPTNFLFLSYVVAHWLWHTIVFDLSNDANVEGESRHTRLFKNLVLGKQLLFDFRPWGDFNRDTHETSSISLLGWALMANHRYLIRLACSAIALPSLEDAWKATCDKYSWGDQGVLLGGAHLNRLDLDYDPGSYTSDSPNLVWLFSRLLWACQKGHIDAIKAVKIGNKTDPQISMIRYLAVAAAARGKLDMVEYFWDELNASFILDLAVSDLTKGQSFTAMEHAAISGYSQVVSYLADHGSRAKSIFTIPGVFQEFFDEAIIENNIPVIASLLTLTIKSANWRGKAIFHVVEQHLSNTLFNAIAADHTEVVRTLLKNGVDPNRSNEVGRTPLIEAIRHSRGSIVSMLLELDCSLGNTAHGMPLTIAACLGNLSIVRELILHGADIFRKPSESKDFLSMVYIDNGSTRRGIASEETAHHSIRLSPTPLYMACYHGHLNVVELLLSCGAEINYPGPTAVTLMQHYKGSSTTIDYLFNWHLSHLDDILSGYLSAGLMSYGHASWELPITAAMTRGHATIVDTLVSSGALWPEEFDNLYGSCLDSLDQELETLATRVFHSVMTGAPPQKNETLKLHMRQKPGFIRTLMIEMGMPTTTASRIYSVAELRNATAASIALQQELLQLKKTRLDECISDLKEGILIGNRNCGDLSQASLIQAAKDYKYDLDEPEDLLDQVLLDAAASLTKCDDDGANLPHWDLVEAAILGNYNLRHALVDMGVAAAVTSVTGPRKPFSREYLARMIQKSISPRMGVSRATSRAYKICEILEAAVYSNDKTLIRRLYELLVFISPNSVPRAALYAAIDYGNQPVVELLYTFRADFNSNIHMRDYNGATPLLYAVEQGAPVSVIDTLLSHGADPRVADPDGETVLYKAASSCNFELLDCLLNSNYGHDRFCLDTMDLNKAQNICVLRCKPEAWNRLARAFRDRHSVSLEKTKIAISGETGITHRYLNEPASIPHDRHGPFAASLTTYEKARGAHLLYLPCQCVEGMFELSAVQEQIEPPPYPVPVVHAEEPKRSTRFSEAAAALLENHTQRNSLLGYEHIA